MSTIEDKITQILVNQGIHGEILVRVEKQANATNGRVLKLEEKTRDQEKEMAQFKIKLDQLSTNTNSKVVEHKPMMKFTWDKVLLLVTALATLIAYVIDKLA